jgi:UDP-N-acetylmuramyl tripeptide synthase
LTTPLPFEDSRRLTGPSFLLPATGAVLEVTGGEMDDALLAEWRARVERARVRLGWPAGPLVARIHADGASLALAAPCDQLFTATEVNEWAYCSALQRRDPSRWAALAEALVEAAKAAAGEGAPAIVHESATAALPVLEEPAALARLEHLATAEARADLRALLDAAESRGLTWVLDDATLTLGGGAGSRSYALGELPFVSDVPWSALHDVPVAVVTGSNGKTTTVRLIAECARAHGRGVGYNCTDGVFVDGSAVDTGDYSGPAGARMVLRDARVDVAVCEAARGGILRRGLAVSRAQVAVVTNVSADHFGEYGIHDLEALADVKLTVAGLVGRGGLLVLNANDEVLSGRADRLAARFGRAPSLGWFALDDAHPTLAACRARGGPTCGVRGGRLVSSHGEVDHDLGAVAEMPLTVQGSAAYNVANLAAAALAATSLGVPPLTVASVFARFGRDPGDNYGRLMRFEIGGARVLVDYAHNPEGLRGVLRVAEHLRAGKGRLALLLGHAGNREDADIEQVAAVATEVRPDLVVVKEIEGYLRGRAAGEVPRILRDALLRLGVPSSALQLRMSELEAARHALDWARPGDVVVLLVHSLAARRAVLALIDDRCRPALTKSCVE